jgi:hypothetical protein
LFCALVDVLDATLLTGSSTLTDDYPTIRPTCLRISLAHSPFAASQDVPCNNTVGYWNLYDFFRSEGFHCEEGMLEAECWELNTMRKLSPDFPGAWYSTLAQGCATPTDPTPDCTWRVVSVDAIIQSDCHKRQFLDAVAAYNQTCFNACPNPT